ncbi:MAG: rhomboid family intramembrane serine protease [Pseudomonadota bacterium]
MSSQMPADLVQVFRSFDRAQCDDRAFMLSAVSIPSEVDTDTTGYVVRVAYAQAAFATHHLWHYEQELRRRPRMVLPQARAHPYAWVGSALYVLLLSLVATIVVRGWWRPDTFIIGTLDAGAVQAGQWWRAITALTLHLDIVHLLMNLGAGAAIGFLAGRQIGVGHAWLLTLLGAGLANLVEAIFSMPGHQSVGASTAVFAALGLLAAHSWRTRGAVANSRLRRWAPLVAGAALLGFLGTGASESTADAGTDIIAHAFGFLVGAGLGVLAAHVRVAALLSQIPQWITGVITLGLVGISWWMAGSFP